MSVRQSDFSGLPAVHDVLRDPQFLAASSGLADVSRTRLVRRVISRFRAAIHAGTTRESTPAGLDAADVVQACVAEAHSITRRSPRRVINGTGVLVHTNLGRAPLRELVEVVAGGELSGYTDLEWDAASQSRGQRDAALQPQLALLAGSESALVVNNCAGALVLALATLGSGKEVLVSRSELVEIGGSFRVPEIMEASGCRLREVGTTNRTRVGDFEQAAAGAAVLLKVHQSNFVQRGFVEQVSLPDLVVLGRTLGIPVVEDNGSGLFTDHDVPTLADEPRVVASIEAGVDVVCCSGDKLFGSVQAGLIFGKTRYIDAMRGHPLYRALRVDKVRLALLEHSARAHLAGAATEIPVWRLFHLEVAELEQRARTLKLPDAATRWKSCQLVPLRATLGGGSSPDIDFASFGLELVHHDLSAEALKRCMAGRSIPIVGYVKRDRYHLDLRTVFMEDYVHIQSALDELSTPGSG